MRQALGAVYVNQNAAAKWEIRFSTNIAVGIIFLKNESWFSLEILTRLV